MSQTSYDVNQPVALPGLIADLTDDMYIESAANEEADAVEYGKAVIEGTADDQFLRVTDAAQAVLGVTVHEHDAPVDCEGGNLIKPKRTASIMRRGKIYVQVEDAVSKGSVAFVRVAAGPGGTIIGDFRSDADGGSARELTHATYRTSAAAGGFAVLEITEMSALV